MRPLIPLVVCFLAFLFSAHQPLRAERAVLVAGGKQPVAALPATESQLDGPFGVDFDTVGQAFLIEISGHRILKIDRVGILTKVGGTGDKGNVGDGGPAMRAQFNGMHSLVVAKSGDIYVADTWNNRVRMVAADSGNIQPVAGTGEKGFSGDGGAALQAKCGGIYCIALDAQQERLYLADLDNRRIRMVELKTGVIATVAGNGERGVPADGAVAAAAPLVDPRAVAADSRGNVYILERSGNALRVVDRAGKIRTVAGTGKPGFSGDGGDAKLAELRGPKHICVDRDDNVLIADAENNVIRKYVAADGRIVRVAGSGTAGSEGVGGPADQLQLKRPHGVGVDQSGTVYIVDSGNDRLLKLVK
jgi:DNA-binding beta-propeller fold protein YncE